MKRQRVLVEEPHIQSMAALVLLIEDLQLTQLNEYLVFKETFFSKFDTLTCFWCGKENLQIETSDIDVLATIDHKKVVSQGGDLMNEENCLVSCFRCNNNRKDLDFEEYKKRKHK